MVRMLSVAIACFVLSIVVAYRNPPPIVELKIDEAFAHLTLLRLAMDERLRLGLQLPDESKGLLALLEEPAQVGKLPADPWGSAYLYKRADVAPGYIIYSAGKNRTDENGAGDDVTDRTKVYACNEYGVGCPMKSDEIAFSVASIVALLSLLCVSALSVLWVTRRIRARSAA